MRDEDVRALMKQVNAATADLRPLPPPLPADAARWNGSRVSRDDDAAPLSVEQGTGPPWLERASDLLAEPDPGPTPFAVEGLLVAGAIGAIQGPPKARKTYLVLELAMAIVTGRQALGRFAIPDPGAVMLLLEESGRAALHRRLDMLARGNAIEPAALAELHFAANKRVRLNDPDWQAKLIEAGKRLRPRAIFLDPLARLKGATVDENAQREIGPVLDFLGELRDETDAAVAFVHHEPHAGSHLRGSSDLEAFWESKLTVTRSGATFRLAAEHREAEETRELRFRLVRDDRSDSIRLAVVEREDELREEVAAYLAEHPEASGNEVAKALKRNRNRVLALVSALRAEDDPMVAGGAAGAS